jgi:hypothetical protein
MEVTRRVDEAPSRPLDDPTVIFLHIGKTAGTTLRQVMRRNVPAARTLVVRVRGGSREETVDRFASLPEEERAAHRHVPRPSTYVSMLRKPMSLVLSQYRFVLRTPGHRHHELVTSKGMSLEDYIRSGVSIEMDNSQTRAIAGDRATPYGACTDAMLETAKRNLEDFAVVGLTERFDESLVLLGKRFGWTRLN